MNIKSLRVFVNIVEEGTLAKASERMNLSTPAASRLLGLLEDELGGLLFHRKHSRLIPTLEAEQFYDEAIRALNAFDNVPKAFREIARGTERPLRIACAPRLNHSLVLPTVCRMAKTHPDMRFHLETTGRGSLTSLVVNNMVDVGVGPLPATSELLDTEYICDSRLLVLLPPGHPLAARKELSFGELKDLTYIGLRQNSLIRVVLESGLAGGEHREPHHIVSTAASACQLLRAGIGFTIADRLSLAAKYAQGIPAVPLVPRCSLDVGLYMNREARRLETVNAFLATLKEVAREADAAWNFG